MVRDLGFFCAGIVVSLLVPMLVRALQKFEKIFAKKMPPSPKIDEIFDSLEERAPLTPFDDLEDRPSVA